jgi:hypothetical protein
MLGAPPPRGGRAIRSNLLPPPAAKVFPLLSLAHSLGETVQPNQPARGGTEKKVRFQKIEVLKNRRVPDTLTGDGSITMG